MAAESSQTSADSYIGSSISLMSKSEIRYEGVLFRINAHECSIGLKNVRSFGTEGRRKEGSQVLPSDKVYDYVYFRGSDIKDLQVLSSPTVQSTPAVPDDPAIIQSHYQEPSPPSLSLPHASTANSGVSFNFNSQLGLQSLTLQGSLPQNQPMGNVGSWTSSPLPTINSIASTTPLYWQGFHGPTEGISPVQQQQPSFQPPPGLLVSPGSQQTQHSTTGASLPNGTSKVPEAPHPLLPALQAAYSSSVSVSPSASIPSVFPSFSNLITGSSAILPANEGRNHMANSEPSLPASVALVSTLPLLAPLTPVVNTDNVLPHFAEKPRLTLDSTSHYQSMASSPSIIGTSDSRNIEAPTPSLVTPGQLLQSISANQSAKLLSSIQTAQKDIEVVQTSSSESLSTELKESETRTSAQPSTSAGKLNGTHLDSQQTDKGMERARRKGLNGVPSDFQYHDKGHEQERRNAPHRAASHMQQTTRRHWKRRENEPKGDASHPHHGYKIHLGGRRNGLHGTAPRTYLSHKGHAWGTETVMNGGSPRPYHGGRGRARGRISGISHAASKFAEDFDFVAMNEKFNKDEVWDQLGKATKVISKDDEAVNGSEDVQDDNADGLPQVEIKPVYVKDYFFDSLSCNTFNHEPKKGRAKFSEQKKLDAETFGNTHRGGHGGRGGRGGGRGGWSYGSRYGRGQGRATWGRVT